MGFWEKERDTAPGEQSFICSSPAVGLEICLEVTQKRDFS
jgi:hypothetical protein